KSCGTFELSDERIKCAVGVLGRAEITQPRVWFGRKGLHERGAEPGFADPGLTGWQHHLPPAGLGSRPASQDQSSPLPPPAECGQATRVHSPERARTRTCP